MKRSFRCVGVEYACGGLPEAGSLLVHCTRTREFVRVERGDLQEIHDYGIDSSLPALVRCIGEEGSLTSHLGRKPQDPDYGLGEHTLDCDRLGVLGEQELTERLLG